MTPTLAAPKVPIKLVPVPKTIVYAALSAEMVRNLGMKDADQITAIQQAVAEGLVARVMVHARHPNGNVEAVTLTMKPFGTTDTVELHLENGKSFTEAMDVGLAAALQYCADLIKRRGLTPRFVIDWSDRAKASPAIIAHAVRRLNLQVESLPLPPPVPVQQYVAPSVNEPPPAPPVKRYPQTVQTYTAPPVLPPQHELKKVLEITPAKDSGITFTYETTRKKD